MKQFHPYLVVMLFLFPLGCAKKPAKVTESSNESASTSPPPPPASTKGKSSDKTSKDKEKPNWLNDPGTTRAETTSGEGTPAGGLPGKPGWGISKPDGGWTSPNPQPGPTNPGAAGGTATIVPNPAGPGVTKPNAGASPPTGTSPTNMKPVSEADMKDVWIYIENRSGASGQMPTTQEVYSALVTAKSPAAELARGGSIVLTGSRMRDSIWAYEAKATTQGGLVASQNGVETLTAAELLRRLAAR